MNWSSRLTLMLVAGTGFFCLSQVPHQQALHQAQSQLSNIQYQTKTLTYMKPNIKINKVTDVTKAEQEATQQLTDGFTEAFNDVNSNDEYKAKKNEIANKIGMSTVKSIHDLRYFDNQDWWDKTSDLVINVSFEPVKSTTDVEALVTATYKLDIKGDDGKIRTSDHQDLWKIHYNLETKKVLSSSHIELFETAEEAREANP